MFIRDHPGCAYQLTDQGIEVGGVPIGTAEFVTEYLDEKFSKVSSEIKKLESMLHLRSLQNLYSILTYCCNSRVLHIAQVLPPTITTTFLHRFDKLIMKVARTATGIDIPKQDVIVQQRFPLPTRLNGGRLRRSKDVAPAAYISNILNTLPSMMNHKDRGVDIPGILPHMADVFGEDSFQTGNEKTRLKVFLQHLDEVPSVKHFLHHWKQLRSEIYGHDATQDDIPSNSPFKPGVNGADMFKEEKLQNKITKLREEERVRQMVQSILKDCKGQQFNDTPQHVMAFLSTDRFSQQFVGIPATNTTTLGNDFFLEAWATYMGTPSPICSPWIGSPCSYLDSKGKSHTFTIDSHGNSITSTIMRGDHWRQRHDSLKHVLLHIANWSKFPIGCEVYGMFSLYIKNAAKSANMTVKQKQAIVPDFHIGKDNTLADVKTMSCCKSHYPPERFRKGIRHDAVRVRQQKVHNEYKVKAHKADKDFNDFDGTPNSGPVATRLSSFGRIKGLVSGTFGEGSTDLHDLCEQMASSPVSHRSYELGATSAGGILSSENKSMISTTDLLCEITDLFFPMLLFNTPICFF